MNRRWTRANKVWLAEQVRTLLEQGQKPGEMALALGKTTTRILQIRKLFSLPDWRRVR